MSRHRIIGSEAHHARPLAYVTRFPDARGRRRRRRLGKVLRTAFWSAAALVVVAAGVGAGGAAGF